MKMNKLLQSFLLGIFIVVPAGVFADAGSSVDDLDSLIATALANNPELQSLQDQFQSAAQMVAPADDLADPVISFAFSNYPVDSFASDETAMTGNELKLAQMLPFPGKLKAKKEVAAQDEIWFKGVYEDARLELTRKVKEAYYRLYAIDRSIATVKSNLALLDDLSRLAETRYQVGKGKQADVLNVQLERTRQRDRLIQLEAKRVTVQGGLNTLTDRPAGQAIVTPEKIEIAALDLDLETLKHQAEENRPLFAAWQARVEKARDQQKLARLDYKPDMTLWASYRFRDDNLPDRGTDFASAGISFNLPLNRSRRASAVKASEAKLNQAHNQFADFRNKVGYAIDDAFSAARRSYDLYQLYRTGIVPQARQLYAATLSAYQVGNADFAELLSALLNLDRYETELHGVVSDYLQAVARLESAGGINIPVISKEG